MTTTTIALKKPHSDKQRSMIEYDGNVVAFCGRRFGKTDGYVQRIYYKMQQKPGLYWWVGLSWQSASLKRAWRETSDIARQILHAQGLSELHHINRSTHEIRLPGLGEIWFRSAENPASLAGEGILGAVGDEFSLWPEMVWTEYLEATLVDKAGWVALSGVPKGRNWASNLWLNAADREGWLQVHATSYDNPHIDHSRLDEIRLTTPEHIWRQEYMAEILENGSVFRFIRDAVRATEQKSPIPGHNYVIGCDWGQKDDFTVMTVMDATTNDMATRQRMNKADYTLFADRLEYMVADWNPVEVVSEENGMEALHDMLAKRNIPLRKFRTTRQSKEEIIGWLIRAFDEKKIGIIDDPILISELQMMEMTPTTTGFRYEAPAGYHDDMVMSLALAWDGVRKNSGTVTVKRKRRI